MHIVRSVSPMPVRLAVTAFSSKQGAQSFVSSSSAVGPVPRGAGPKFSGWKINTLIGLAMAGHVFGVYKIPAPSWNDKKIVYGADKKSFVIPLKAVSNGIGTALDFAHIENCKGSGLDKEEEAGNPEELGDTAIVQTKKQANGFAYKPLYRKALPVFEKKAYDIIIIKQPKTIWGLSRETNQNQRLITHIKEQLALLEAADQASLTTKFKKLSGGKSLADVLSVANFEMLLDGGGIDADKEEFAYAFQTVFGLSDIAYQAYQSGYAAHNYDQKIEEMKAELKRNKIDLPQNTATFLKATLMALAFNGDPSTDYLAAFQAEQVTPILEQRQQVMSLLSQINEINIKLKELEQGDQQKGIATKVWESVAGSDKTKLEEELGGKVAEANALVKKIPKAPYENLTVVRGFFETHLKPADENLVRQLFGDADGFKSLLPNGTVIKY